jgi:hypothetical protein
MKILIALTFSVMFLAAADKPARVIRPVEIPKGAVESEPGTYRFKDAEGRKWIYRKTPFGVARIPDQPAPANPAPAPDSFAEVKAFDAGDAVRFERPGPFGVYRWQTSKSELSEMERAAWDRARQK